MIWVIVYQEVRLFMCHCLALRGINVAPLLYPNLNCYISVSTGSCFHHCRSGDEFRLYLYPLKTISSVFSELFFFCLVLQVYHCWTHHFVALGFFSLFHSPTNLHSFTSDHLRLPLSPNVPSCLRSTRGLSQLFRPTFPSSLCVSARPASLFSFYIHHTSLLSFLFMDSSLSSCVCVCVRVCYVWRLIAMPRSRCEGSRERGLDRRSAPWQNRNRIGLRRINPAGLSYPLLLFFCLSLSFTLTPSICSDKASRLWHTHRARVRRQWWWFNNDDWFRTLGLLFSQFFPPI